MWPDTYYCAPSEYKHIVPAPEAPALRRAVNDAGLEATGTLHRPEQKHHQQANDANTTTPPILASGRAESTHVSRSLKPITAGSHDQTRPRRKPKPQRQHQNNDPDHPANSKTAGRNQPGRNDPAHAPSTCWGCIMRHMYRSQNYAQHRPPAQKTSTAPPTKPERQNSNADSTPAPTPRPHLSQ